MIGWYANKKKTAAKPTLQNAAVEKEPVNDFDQ